MKDSKKSTKVEKNVVEKTNDFNGGFAKWLESVKAKQTEIESQKAAKRLEKSGGSTNFNLKANVILEIYNAGNKGIKVSEILTKKPLQFSRKNKATGLVEEVETFNPNTLGRDWGVYDQPMQHVNEWLIENGYNVGFEVTTLNEKNKFGTKDNLIVLPEMFKPEVERYLKSQSNFNEEWLKA